MQEQHTSDKQQQQILLLADQYMFRCGLPEFIHISVENKCHSSLHKHVNTHTNKQT